MESEAVGVWYDPLVIEEWRAKSDTNGKTGTRVCGDDSPGGNMDLTRVDGLNCGPQA